MAVTFLRLREEVAFCACALKEISVLRARFRSLDEGRQPMSEYKMRGEREQDWDNFILSGAALNRPLPADDCPGTPGGTKRGQDG